MTAVDSTPGGTPAGGIAAIMPWRLSAGTTGQFSPALLPCIELAKRWQTLGLHAQFWELANQEQDRLYELAGYMAGAGEQLALACLADHEFSLWTAAPAPEQDFALVATEMAQRALAEMESYYVIAGGHAIANLTGRVLALDPALKPQLAAAKAIQTDFPPFSSRKQDWLSLNPRVAHALQKIARASRMPSFTPLADPAVKLADSDAWRELDEVRGEHFHRWRSQSAGMTGAPKSSPWTHTAGIRTMNAAGGRLIGQDPADMTAARARQTAATAREALRAEAEAFTQRMRLALADAVGLELSDAG